MGLLSAPIFLDRQILFHKKTIYTKEPPEPADAGTGGSWLWDFFYSPLFCAIMFIEDSDEISYRWL